MPTRLPPFETDLARASTLPAFAYTDDAILAAERTSIFRRTWQPIGRAEDVRKPGTFLTGDVVGMPIVVTREMSGVLHAFHNVCRHRAGPVAIGKGARKSLTCKYHGWSYALDGKLVTTPELGQVESFDKACHGLRQVQVEVFGPIVFVNLDVEAEPLSSVLGDIPNETTRFRLDEMRLVANRNYELESNWKTYVDNFLEGYHLPTVHPGLFKELDYDAYRVETHRLYSTQIAPIRPVKAGSTTDEQNNNNNNNASTSKRHYAQPSPNEQEALYYWVFPNWMLNIYPDNMSLNVVIPIAPNRTLTVFEWYRHDGDDAPKEEIDRMVEFSDGIQREDIEICEAVQRGLASGSYEQGRFSALRENGVHHFQRLVHEHLLRR